MQTAERLALSRWGETDLYKGYASVRCSNRKRQADEHEQRFSTPDRETSGPSPTKKAKANSDSDTEGRKHQVQRVLFLSRARATLTMKRPGTMPPIERTWQDFHSECSDGTDPSEPSQSVSPTIEGSHGQDEKFGTDGRKRESRTRLRKLRLD